MKLFDFRLSSSALDSVILAMSKRIIGDENEVKLLALLNSLDDKLDPSTRVNALRNVDYNKAFISSNEYQEVSGFLKNYFRNTEEIENQLRLPKSSIPKHYKVHIDARNIHTGDKNYKGEVEIEVLIAEETEYIIFHSKNQVIDELLVLNKTDLSSVSVYEHHLYPAVDTLTIYFQDTIAQGTTLLVRIKYSTTMMTYEAGFYQTSYEIDGEKRYLGATQLQASDARFAFPCYDEPEYKAVFELSITHNNSVNAIANTMGEPITK